ncbi:MAG: UDP-N-acetylmuramoyl-L-alanine--D-glutamate ligase [Bacillota bacterium]|nr:UDP-N-acetylmuramoyl-L-alanine--D-glutamate ligase [Bacillota bacterium]
MSFGDGAEPTGQGGSGGAGGSYRGERVAVVGLGRSNLPLVRWLVAQGARVTVFDRQTEAELDDRLRALAGLDVEKRLGPGYLEAGLRGFDRLVLTPGMRFDLPQLEEARRAGARLDGEIAILLRELALRGACVVGVTGSSGKTTTTTLTGRIFASAGRRTWVGGNIGDPLIDRVERIGAGDVVVLELSSFQLRLLDRSPQAAAILNVRPNHLDVHPSFEDYVESKRRIVRFQSPGDVAVLNAEDAACRATEAPGRRFWFALERAALPEEGEGAAWVEGGRLRLRWLGREEELGEAEAIPLRGRHNVANVLAAAALARALDVPPPVVWRAVLAFRPVEHRLEVCGRIGGATWVNDSIATAPDRTIAGLDAFTEPIVLIAGGYDKHLSYRPLAERMLTGLRAAILLGQTGPLIARELERAAAERGLTPPPLVRVGSLEEAVEAARLRARPGDVVLLSPASASYDMFRDFEERGRRFKELVARLEREEAAGAGGAAEEEPGAPER